ncbi:MAG: putative membrane protein [Dokdonia sp.]|jgi:uncharacterized membrane protein
MSEPPILNDQDGQEEVPEELLAILDDPDISPEKKEEIKDAFILSITSITRSFSGPIPPPDVLNDYNQVIPDAAERILQMAEKQSEHRMFLEKTVIPEQVSQSKRGQIFGFIAAIICFILTLIFGLKGEIKLAVAIITVTVLGLSSIFVLGKIYSNKKQEDNSEDEE